MENFLIAIVTLVPLLLVLVVVHELGHLLTARAMGVKALEFGVGFPPRAFGFYTGRTPVGFRSATRFYGMDGSDALKPGQRVRVTSMADDDGSLLAVAVELREKGVEEGLKGINAAKLDLLQHEGKVREVGPDSFVLADMLWSVNVTPLGGFVRLAGESNPEVPGSLAGKSPLARFLVLVAGPLMNAVLPLAVFAGLSMAPQDVVVGRLVVSEVGVDTAAAAAQLQPGDVILQANGTKIENPIGLTREVNLNGGSRMKLLLERDGEERLLYLEPRFDLEAGRWVVGIAPQLVDARVESRSQPVWEAVPNSFVKTWEMLVLVKQALSGAFSPRVRAGTLGANRHRATDRGNHAGGRVRRLAWRRHTTQHQPGHPEHPALPDAGRRAHSIRRHRVGPPGQAHPPGKGRAVPPDRPGHPAGRGSGDQRKRHSPPDRRPHLPGLRGDANMDGQDIQDLLFATAPV